MTMLHSKGRPIIIQSLLPFFVLNLSRFVILPLLCVYIFGLVNCVTYSDDANDVRGEEEGEGSQQNLLVGERQKQQQVLLLPLPIYTLSIDTTDNETDDELAATCTRRKRKRAAVPVTLVTKVCLEVVGVYSLVLQRGAPPYAVIEFCLGKSNDRSLFTRKGLTRESRGPSALSKASSVHVQNNLWSWASSKIYFLFEQVVGLTFANSIPVFVSDASIKERALAHQSQETLSHVDGAMLTRNHSDGEGAMPKEVFSSKTSARNGATDGYQSFVVSDDGYISTNMNRFYKTTIRTPAALLKLAASESSFVALHAYIASVQATSKAEVRSFLSAYTSTRPIAFWRRVLASLKVNARRVVADCLECFPPFSFSSSSSPLPPSSSCVSASPPSLLPALGSVFWLVLLPSLGVGLTALVRPSSLLVLIIFFCSPTSRAGNLASSWSASSDTRTLALYESDLALRRAHSSCEQIDLISGVGGRERCRGDCGDSPLKGGGTARFPGIGAVALAVVSCVLVPLFDIIHACLVRGRKSLSLSFFACVLGRTIVSVASQTVAAMVVIVFASLVLIIVVSTAAVLEGQ